MPAPHAQSTPSVVLTLLPKLHDADADLRYMSLNDLSNVLNNGAPGFLASDYMTCAKTIDSLLESLDDSNGEVQSQAIKCLGALTIKLPAEILPPLIEKLTNLKTTQSVDSSVPATALRTFLIAFQRPLKGVAPSKNTQEAYSAVSKVLVPRLVGYVVIPHGMKGLPNPPPGMLEPDPSSGVDSDAVDVLNEMISCFGPMLQDSEKQALQKAILAILDDTRTGIAIKKKAVTALSALAVYMSDTSLKSFVASLIESFKQPKQTRSRQRLLISVVGSLGRWVSNRIGPYLQNLVPYILDPLSQQGYDQVMDGLSEDGTPDEEEVEVREAALVALEVLLTSCVNDMRSFTDESIAAASRYVAYDPNTVFDEDDDNSDGMQVESGDVEDGDEDGLQENEEDTFEEEDFEEEGLMSDDEDTSWKLRRCAAKALNAIISTRSDGDLLEDGVLYNRIAPILIRRFQEQVENVRLEILSAMATLIRRTGDSFSSSSTSGGNGFESAPPVPRSRKRRRLDSDAGTYEVPGFELSSLGLISPAASPVPTSGPKADLARISPSILRGLAKLLVQKSLSTKQIAMDLLRSMVLVQHGGLGGYLSKIVDPLVSELSSPTNGTAPSSLTGSASTAVSKLRIEALLLASAICDTHSSKVVVPHMGKLVPAVATSVKDKYLKVSSEAIGVVESVVKALTPPRSAGTESQNKIYLESLYEVILNRIAATDADLEVRQKAIHALGVLMARSIGLDNPPMLDPDKKSRAFIVLQERLKNETTRLAAVQAVDLIVSSANDTKALPKNWLQTITVELGAQLRKADRRLSGASLAALRSLATSPAAVISLNDKTIRELAVELLTLIGTNELSFMASALIILERLVAQSPKSVMTPDTDRVLWSITINSTSTAVVEAFLALVKTIGEQGVGQPLMQGFLREVGVSGDPILVGKAIGVLLVSGGSSVGVRLGDFQSELRGTKDALRQCLALSILGEAGLRLGPSSPLEPKVFTDYFNSKSIQVSRTAATALGRAGAGNIEVYMPVILSKSDKAGNSQYLALHSIKEVLQYMDSARADISPYAQDIWNKLFFAAQAEDNKALGAECIGRLVIFEPRKFLALLLQHLQDPKPAVRGMIIQAFRFVLADSDDHFDEYLRPVLVNMLGTMLDDPDLENRRLALGAVNAATNNKPEILLPHLTQLVPSIMKESHVKPELVREVQMGPFKHKVDDGLEIRKSAYELLYSLMDSAYNRINPSGLFDRVVAGLGDEHEVLILSNLMLSKLITLDPDETSRHLDSISEQFRIVVAFKPKENAVKQELEKASEATRSVLKMSLRLHNAFPAPTSGPQGHRWLVYYDGVSKDFGQQMNNLQMDMKAQDA